MKVENPEWKLLLEMRDHLALGLVSKTLTGYDASLEVWRQFCEEVSITSWTQCSVDVAVGWMGWIRKRGHAESGVRQVAVFPLRCLELLQQLKPKAVHPTFVIPYAQLPVSYSSYRGEVITEARLKQIMAHCVREVEETTVLSRTSIIPFLVLFCLRTGMNVDSVMNLPRDCTVATGAGHTVYWQKNRSRGAMHDYYGPADWGAVEIIHALLRMHDNPFVFSYGNGRAKPLGQMSHEVRAWCRKNEIAEFTLKEIRPSKATLIYQESGGKVSEVQRFLHHANLNTTIIYLSENVIRPINEKVLAAGQDALLERWGIPTEGGV
jgi:integrase